MAFCTNCGAQVQGPFCGNCGTQAKTSAPGPTGSGTTPGPFAPVPPTATPAAPPASPTAPTTAAKTSPLIWVLAGCGGLVVLAALVFGFIAFKAKQFVHRAQRNPAYAAARLMAAANP